MPRQTDTEWMDWLSIERVSVLSEDEIADLEDKVTRLPNQGRA